MHPNISQRANNSSDLIQSRDRPVYNSGSEEPPASVASSGTLYRPASRLITARPRQQTVQINIPDYVSTEHDLDDTIEVSRRGEDNIAELGLDADSFSEVVMAVDIRDRGTVGCSYYAAREEKLYFMEDVKLGGPDVVEACKASPSILKLGLT